MRKKRSAQDAVRDQVLGMLLSLLSCYLRAQVGVCVSY